MHVCVGPGVVSAPDTGYRVTAWLQAEEPQGQWAGLLPCRDTDREIETFG